jgi:hypothetical protein
LAPILVVFGTHFGTIFLYISRLPENLYFATNIVQNAHLYLPSPLILGPNFNQNLMFFRVSFLDTLFSTFFQHDAQNHDCWTPLGIQLGPKWRPELAKWPPKSSNFIFTVVPLCAPGIDLVPWSLSECHWASFGLILIGSWMLFQF